jgi:hypothetical protein
MNELKKIFLVMLLAIAGIQLSAQIYMTKKGMVSFVSEAPLEVIKARSQELSGAINLADNKFAFIVPNQSLKGFNSPLQQEHFYENYMEVDKYASSTFQGKIIETIDPTSKEVQQIRAKGILFIHGIEQERIIKANIRFEGNKIIVNSVFSVPLEEHKITIPKIVYQKIAEVINVEINAELILKTE